MAIINENRASNHASPQTNRGTLPAPSPIPLDGKRGAIKTVSWRGYTSELPKQWSRSAPWRQTIQRNRIMLLDDLLRLELEDEPSQQERAFLITELLEDANAASTQTVGLRKWWWGTEIERASARLAEVAERTIDLLPDDELPARAATASARGSCFLAADDKRLQNLDALLQQSKTEPPDPDTLRSSIVEVLRAAHTQSCRNNQEARYLRNRLLIASAASLLFSVMLLVAQWRLPETSFLGTGTRQSSAWAYLLVVMLFGSVGALFTAIPAVSNIPSSNGPFNLPLQQALLKVVFAPLVAVIGIAMLSSGAVQVGTPTTWPALMLIAAVFGAGQHVVTRYVDQRAGQILTAEAPSPQPKPS